MKQGEAWEQPMRGDVSSVSDCLFDYFDQEKWTLSDARSPVTSVVPREGGRELISVESSVWAWSILLLQRDGHVLAKPVARTAGVNPMLAKSYYSEKVRSALAACGAY
ncbi:hypothetical protein [Bordetella ansorpii]|uniref:hypothetical protein n=1 Tax=Bordetella ansorpii TaxID=288768 RepID=UPI0012E705F2|nr:hypothetical protein [Bordetella ansorpii]